MQTEALLLCVLCCSPEPLPVPPPPCRLANDIADLLAPQSGAYYDVWLDGEKFYSHTMEASSVQRAVADHCRAACCGLPLLLGAGDC